MNISYNWLQEYIAENLPTPAVVSDTLTRGAYEVEGVEAIGDDHIFDIDVLPNRASDSLSHIGVARELAVLQDFTFKKVEPQPAADSSVSTSEALTLSVGTEKCRRALKQLAVDVAVAPSPDWLKNRLETLGQKSINNVVDITNFIMLELGQPVHAFDYDKLAGDKGGPKNVTIRPAKESEKITTLDGDTYELTEDMLVIADDEKALDIAGIKGGAASGIDEGTTRVLLSACSFAPTNIRQTSQALNLRTDASKRFENNVPPATAHQALDRFAELLATVCDASVAADVAEVYPEPAAAYKVGVTTTAVNSLLGTDISEAEIIDILERLGCAVTTAIPREFVLEEAAKYKGVPYEYGASVTKDAPEKFDCSSFISWLYVQAGIAVPRDSAGQFVYTKEITKDELQTGDIIFSNTGHGSIHYESKFFMAGTSIPDGVDHCGIYLGDGEVIHASRHNEPASVQVEKLADSKAFASIVKYGRVPGADSEHIVATIPDFRPDLRRSVDLIEEVARVSGYDELDGVLPTAEAPDTSRQNVLGVVSDFLTAHGLTEVKTYSLVSMGDIELANPVAENKSFLRTTLRDNIEAVLEKNETHLPVLKADQLAVFEVGRVFSAAAEETEVVIGIASDDAAERISDIFTELSELLDVKLSLEIENGIGTAKLPDFEHIDIDTTDDNFIKEDTFAPITFQAPSAYPYVLRDVAVWTPDGTTAEAVEEIIADSAGDLLVACNHFDTYEKDEQISYAFKLVFQSREETLSDEIVNEQMAAVEAALEGEEGFSVR